MREIINKFPNFNDAAVEVYEWIKNNCPTIYWDCEYVSMWILKQFRVGKMDPTKYIFTNNMAQ